MDEVYVVPLHATFGVGSSGGSMGYFAFIIYRKKLKIAISYSLHDNNTY